MKIISIINYKGGVGKTTVTANLGVELAYRGRKVLLIDLDAQASLTFSLVRPDYWQKNLAADKTIKKWYDSTANGKPISLSSIVLTPGKVRRVIDGASNGGKLDLIPSHLGLINVDLELATELGGASIKQNKLNYLRVHQRLAAGLDDPAFAQYDLVLIDCPPNFNVVTKTAIVASDHILIPAKADYLSTLGIEYLRRSLEELVEDYNDYVTIQSDGGHAAPIGPEILGVVFTMIQLYADQPISALRPYIDQTKKLGVTVFDNYIRENKTWFGDAAQEGLPVVFQDRAGARILVKEIEELVSEFETRLGI